MAAIFTYFALLPIANGNCNSMFEIGREKWRSEAAIVQNIPLRQLFRTGVSHLKIPEELLFRMQKYPRSFLEIREKRVEDKSEREAYEREVKKLANGFMEAIDSFVKEEFQKFFPDLKLYDPIHWEKVFFGFVGQHELQTPYWHVHYIRDRVPRYIELSKREGLSNFKLVVTCPYPVDLYPSTLVRPFGGEFEGRSIQGEMGTLTVFLYDFTKHATPTSTSATGVRTMLSLQYDVRSHL